MLIKNFPSGPFATNAYVVACPNTQEAAIVDPAPNSFDVLVAFITANKLTPKQILLTHSHWDHIADAAALKAHYHIPIVMHTLDKSNLEHPGSDGLPCWISIPEAQADRLVEENDAIHIGQTQWQVIHTPGHTPGGVCFYCPAEHMLLSGDTLFKGSIGNLSFPTCQPNLMWPSLHKLAHLPKETRVYPGHGLATTIGAESWLPNAQKIFG